MQLLGKTYRIDARLKQVKKCAIRMTQARLKEHDVFLSPTDIRSSERTLLYDQFPDGAIEERQQVRAGRRGVSNTSGAPSGHLSASRTCYLAELG